MIKYLVTMSFLFVLPMKSLAEVPPNGATFLKCDSPSNQLIRIDDHKSIRRYPSATRTMEMNLMMLDGRSPVNSNHFIFNTTVHFMIYVTKGQGIFYVDDSVIQASEGDVLDVPPKTRFAANGHGFEYVTVENPAFFLEQSYIVDAQGKIVDSN